MVPVAYSLISLLIATGIVPAGVKVPFITFTVKDNEVRFPEQISTLIPGISSKSVKHFLRMNVFYLTCWFCRDVIIFAGRF